MIVQIYEVTSAKEAIALVKLGVEHIGVLVGGGKVPREQGYAEAREIFNAVRGKAKCVALSMSRDISEISKVVSETKPDILHLGASEAEITAAKVKEIKKRFPELKVMRAVFVTNEESIRVAKSYEGIADFLLLDTFDNGLLGATGKPHDWSISRKIVKAVKIPVILAGGLGADNVADAIRAVKPAGVDSKTKTDKADTHKKDLEKVKEFVAAAKGAT